MGIVGGPGGRCLSRDAKLDSLHAKLAPMIEVAVHAVACSTCHISIASNKKSSEARGASRTVWFKDQQTHSSRPLVSPQLFLSNRSFAAKSRGAQGHLLMKRSTERVVRLAHASIGQPDS